MISPSLQRRLARMPVDALTPHIAGMIECNGGTLKIQGGAHGRTSSGAPCKPWLHLVLQLSEDRNHILITNQLTGHSAKATCASPRARLVEELAAGLARRDAIVEAARQRAEMLAAREAARAAEGT